MARSLLEKKIRHHIWHLINYLRIQKLEGLLGDEKSKLVLRQVISARALGDCPQSYYGALNAVKETCERSLCPRFCEGEAGIEPICCDADQYFPSDLIQISHHEVFLDAGGYVGDTIESFLKHAGERFARIYSFEPDRKNFQRLSQYIHSLPDDEQNKIRAFPVALSDRAEKVKFNEEGGAAGNIFSSASEGNDEMDVACIKDVLTEGEIADITFIKMDIEGAEPNVLKSLSSHIQNKSPKLAVCVYHKRNHILDIPLYIHELNPAYKIYLRHHSDCRCETVCYAVPDHDF